MVNIHWATILLPVSVVDCVLVHELAHLIEANHTPEFWQRAARALLEYGQRKAARRALIPPTWMAGRARTPIPAP